MRLKPVLHKQVGNSQRDYLALKFQRSKVAEPEAEALVADVVLDFFKDGRPHVSFCQRGQRSAPQFLSAGDPASHTSVFDVNGRYGWLRACLLAPNFRSARGCILARDASSVNRFFEFEDGFRRADFQARQNVVSVCLELRNAENIRAVRVHAGRQFRPVSRSFRRSCPSAPAPPRRRTSRAERHGAAGRG